MTPEAMKKNEIDSPQKTFKKYDPVDTLNLNFSGPVL